MPCWEALEPATIRWWGGWAEGEHVGSLYLHVHGLTGMQKRDTLIRYLLDELLADS